MQMKPGTLSSFHVEHDELGKITLCGSTKFKDEYELWNKRLSLAGFLVYSVAGFGHSGDTFTAEEKIRLDEIHMAKIDQSHAIVVVGDGYVGESTLSEIKHALSTNKRVYSTTHRLKIDDRKEGEGVKLADRVGYVYALRTSTNKFEDEEMRYNAFDWTGE
jgi:hypothetical protein